MIGYRRACGDHGCAVSRDVTLSVAALPVPREDVYCEGDDYTRKGLVPHADERPYLL